MFMLISKAVTEWGEGTDTDVINPGSGNTLETGDTMFPDASVFALPAISFTASAIVSLLMLSSMIMSAPASMACCTSSNVVVSTSTFDT